MSRLTCALAVVFLCAVSHGTAAARDYRIADFQSTLSVSQDGTTAVTERITFVFIGEYHGVYRDIPIEYPGPHRSNYTLFLHVTGITDGEGNKLKYESKVTHGSRHLKIYIPGAVDTTRTVQISYQARNAIRWFEDHDELYWNVTGNDWAVPIDRASATISFPPAAVNNLHAQAFTGVYGSSARDASVEVEGNTVLIASRNPLSMREGLTADVYLNKGVLQEPSKLTQAIWFLRSNFVVLLPLWAFAVMFFFWYTKGRDPKPDMSVAPMYEPPAGLTPAECGALMGDEVHPRDITATLVDLAVKGYIKIEETESRVLLFTHRDYIFHLLKPREEWSGLASHERVMLNHLFSAAADAATGSSPVGKAQASDARVAGGAVAKTADIQVRLSSLRNQFYVAIPSMKSDIMSALKGKGMYSVDPSSAHGYVGLGILMTVGPFVLAHVLGVASVVDSPLLLVASAVVAVIIVFIFARIMTAKSLKGVRTKVQILGFQEFVNRVDADRLKRMPPDTFEKFLPFAMALGIENRWAKVFQGIVQNPPNWYVGPTPYSGFNPIYFTNSMHTMSSDAHSTFVSAPRSSSSGSGWGGGGGSSGGGFGGGGGGAF